MVKVNVKKIMENNFQFAWVPRLSYNLLEYVSRPFLFCSVFPHSRFICTTVIVDAWYAPLVVYYYPPLSTFRAAFPTPSVCFALLEPGSQPSKHFHQKKHTIICEKGTNIYIYIYENENKRKVLARP